LSESLDACRRTDLKGLTLVDGRDLRQLECPSLQLLSMNSGDGIFGTQLALLTETL
jgi:hypothetical protein